MTMDDFWDPKEDDAYWDDKYAYNCIDGDGEFWPEHEGDLECTRCGAEMGDE